MKTYEEKEKKNEKNFIIMILILIALIIIIFLLIRNLGFIEHKPQIPTGNVDIFDIIFQQSCNNSCCKNNGINCNECDICNKNNINCGTFGDNNNNNNGNSNNKNNNDNSNNNNNSNPPIIEDKQDELEVYDNETKFSQNTPLNIFTNTTYYVVGDKISPSSENSYQFVIRNNNGFNINYDLELNEDNKYNINMKYRLKLNGEYVSGSDDEWLTYDEINQYDVKLSANNYNVYTLDWKWVESENDTEVGTNIDSNYKLELKITASGD